MSKNKVREICYYLQLIAAVQYAAALQHQLLVAAIADGTPSTKRSIFNPPTDVPCLRFAAAEENQTTF